MDGFRRLFRLPLIAGLTFSLSAITAAAAPAFDAPVNEQNALALLKEYDSDGYRIVQNQIKAGESSFSFWLQTASSNADALDTAVHEEYHQYSHTKNGWYRNANGTYVHIETICIGRGRSDIIVDELWADGQVYPTENFTKTIPENMRTFRYQDYVSEGSKLSSNKNGIYGLLNEYTAYSMGFNNQMKLYPYYQANKVSDDFFTNCVNDYQAYEEFRYWMLGLLNHEKKHAPAQYKVHMNNMSFLKAYHAVTMNFRDMIREFEKYTETMYQDDSWSSYPDQLAQNKEWRGITMLEKASSAKELKAVEDEIFAKVQGTVPKPTPAPTPVPTPKPSENGTDMHRLYNPNSGEHFYTGDLKEMNALVTKHGWKYEGVGWVAPKSGIKVYRLYNKYGGEHHYTTDVAEKDALVYTHGWTDEGIGWYSDPAETVPVFREYNPNAYANNHNYTPDVREHDALLNIYGWRDEGIAWYGIEGKKQIGK